MTDLRRVQIKPEILSPHHSGRKVWRYENTEAANKSGTKVERWGVDKLRGSIRIPLAVIGTGRCGTTWLARTLQAAGFDIGHEYVGKDGTVSLYFQCDHHWYPYHSWVKDQRTVHVGERAGDFDAQYIVNLVRHPLEVARSMAKIFPLTTYEWMSEVGLLDDPYVRPKDLRCLQVTYEMMKNCRDNCDETIRLKDMEKKWLGMLRKAGLEKVDMPVLPAANRGTGFRKSTPMTWYEADKLDSTLAKNLRKLTRQLKLEE